jgi:hypothetical protein
MYVAMPAFVRGDGDRVAPANIPQNGLATGRKTAAGDLQIRISVRAHHSQREAFPLRAIAHDERVHRCIRRGERREHRRVMLECSFGEGR